MKKFGISQPIRRVEDARLLTGDGAYVDDRAEPGMARALFVRSPIAHARLNGVDVASAKAAPGVLGVYLAADLGAANRVDFDRLDDGDPAPTRPVLAADRVVYVGEPVALIVADTLAAARDAAEAVEFDFEEVEPVVDMRAAIEDGAPQIHAEAPTNVAFDWSIGDEAATDAALAGAARRVSIELENNRVVANPMETRGAVAGWDANAQKLSVEINSQGVWGHKRELADRLGLSVEQVQVTTRDVGGGFGIKSYHYPEHTALAWAARDLGRTVKWTADRSEGFLTDAQGRDHLSRAEAGFDAENRLVALKVETLAGMGAHLSASAAWIPTDCVSKVLTGVYDLQTAYLGVKGVFTNTTPVDAYRGAGRPEAIYLLERLMDRAARELDVDPVALRRANFIKPEQFPYVSATGVEYDCGDFDRVLTTALEKADVAGFSARRAASQAAGKLRGLGYCYYIESILGSKAETATVDIGADGAIDLYVGTQSNGQGHETAYAQLLAERSGLPFEKVRIVQGDSDRIAHGGGTGGSRSVTTQGTAIYGASDALIEQLRPLAEEELEAAAADIVFEDGAYRVAGTDKTVDLAAVAARAHATGRAELARIEKRTKLESLSFPNGCHVAEVEIDLETGATRVARYAIVDDFGVLVNPLLAEGQAQGGVAQGIGQAITERTVYDGAGQLLSGSFMDYAMPRADDAPWTTFDTEPTPSPNNPMGMKGCGEAGTVGALAAVTNAAVDALWPLGVRDVDMPLTPSRVWGMLRAAQPAAAAE